MYSSILSLIGIHTGFVIEAIFDPKLHYYFFCLAYWHFDINKMWSVVNTVVANSTEIYCSCEENKHFQLCQAIEFCTTNKFCKPKFNQNPLTNHNQFNWDPHLNQNLTHSNQNAWMELKKSIDSPKFAANQIFPYIFYRSLLPWRPCYQRTISMAT